MRALRFEGNRALDNYTLSAAIATTNSSWAARYGWIRWLGLGEKRPFDEVEFRRDVVRLLLLYRQSGYMSAVIDTIVRRTPRNVFVTFHIAEGEPVRLRRLDVAGLDGVLDVAALKRSLPIQVGDPFNRFLFLAAADTIVARLRNLGYPYAEVLRNFDTDAGALTAEATLEALPGPRVRVGEVIIEGLEHLDTGTVRKMLSVRPFDIYRQQSLHQSQRDLFAMDVFRTAQVLLEDSLAPADPADTLVRVLVRVSEGRRHRVRFGLGYGTIDCFRVQSGWSARDFLGGARTLDISARVSKLGVGSPTDAGFRDDICGGLHDDRQSDTLNYTAGVTLVQPAFLSPRHRASFGVFAERRSEIQAYTRQAVGFNAAVTFNARRRIPVTLGYGYSEGRTTAAPAVYCSVFQVCDRADRDFLANRRTFAAVTVTAVRDRVDSPLDPTDGSLASVTLVHASRFVGSDAPYEFNRGEFEVAKYLPLGRRSVFAWRVKGGSVLPQRITVSGQSAAFVPPDQRFYAGGPNSVRGFGRNELGPRVYVTDSLDISGTDTTFHNVLTAPTGGNTAFVMNAELRLPAPVFGQRMRMGIFVDIGRVWNREQEIFSLDSMRVTPGVGLRVATPLGPVRLDVAYNGYPPTEGKLLFQTDSSIVTLRDRHPLDPKPPRGFLRRLVFQFAVGQAF